jgi:DNA-binding Lrp family transcriptional regulator
MGDQQNALDEIDRILLRILAQDPRAPYSEIAKRLNEEGYEMTGEGIRYRISRLYESTSLLLLTTPKQHGWENLRLLISTEDTKGAKASVKQRLTEMDFWIVCKGIGSFDLYANATVPSNEETDRLVTEVREQDGVEEVHFHLETDRISNYDNYLSL